MAASDDPVWMKDYLDAHNRYRALHQVGPVKYNEKLNKLAQKWADHLGSKDAFQHSDCKFEATRVGENIAMKMSSSKSDFEGHEFVDQWYSEIERYNFETNSGPSTGHFTQVVWKVCDDIGVGKARTKSGKTIVVGNYLPAGNMMGDNDKNVFPTKDGKFTLPQKDKPKLKGAGQADVCKDHGITGTTGATSGDVQNYRSLRKETLTRRTPDGKVEVVTREIYTMADGSTKTKETRQIKNEDEVLAKTVEQMKLDSANQTPGKDGGVTVEAGNDEGAKSVDAESLKKFRAEVLKAHNDHRKKHGATMLKRNAQLEKVAQQWANHLATSGNFTHSKNEYKGHRLGENIANKWSSAGADYNGQEVTDQWYKEEPQYDYKGDTKALNAGHFTQVVWAGSKELGIGKAKTSNGKCIVVANYYPAGNIIGHFKENVFELTK